MDKFEISGVPFVKIDVIDAVHKNINPENETFIDGIIRVSRGFIKEVFTPQLKNDLIYSIQGYVNGYFDSRGWERAWKTEGKFDQFSGSFIPFFISLGLPTFPIDVEEAQRRINKHGWQIRNYEQELYLRLKQAVPYRGTFTIHEEIGVGAINPKGTGDKYSI